MSRLRHATTTTRLVLAWFLLAIGVAAASPLVHPQIMELVCSASGVVTLQPQGAGQEGGPAQAHGAECAVCLPIAGPAPSGGVPALATAMPDGPAAPLRLLPLRPAHDAVPPPARAPPVAAA